MNTHEQELEFRRRRFKQIRASMRDAGVGGEETDAERSRYVEQLNSSLAEFRTGGDLEGLRSDIHQLSRDDEISLRLPGFNFGVAMFTNQLLKASPDEEALAELLRTSFDVPQNESDADARIGQLLSYVERIRDGAHPAPKSAVRFASFFWWLQAPEDWPFLWPDSEDSMRTLGWLRSDLEPAEVYGEYRSLVRSLHDEHEVVERTLRWFASNPWTGLDEALCDRLDWAEQLNALRVDAEYPEGISDVARTNVAAVLAEMRIIGDHCEEAVANATGRDLRRHIANEFWDRRSGCYRANAWVKWKPRKVEGWNEAPSIMLLASGEGIVVGLSPGRRERGWAAGIRSDLEVLVPSGMELLNAYDPEGATKGDGGEFIVGKWLPRTSALGDPGLADELESTAAAAQPLFDRVMALSGAQSPADQREQDPSLVESFERFVAETGYPTAKDESHQARREEMAALLQPEIIQDMELADFRKIYNGSGYGAPGPQSVLSTTLKSADQALLRGVYENVNYLLWGDGSFEERIDRCLDQSDLGVKGLGESVIMKLLSITHPDRFIPLFPLSGDNGKVAVLEALGEPIPDTKASRGARQVEANDRLRAKFEPFLPGDPWGQTEFAFWLRDNYLEPELSLDERLDMVVEECNLPDRSFVDELKELLEDKRQIVLYGPPGTGKTYIARELARALAPADKLMAFVQFHPSTSYEDFFEGYRPAADSNGNLSYSLESGPFAALADHAAQDTRRHVLVVDELNRANVPKVLGELLFLLEYRNEEIASLYRPDGFALPENLWVIATMNTADRSIATLDAALRRRFHFVPVFPDDGPMAGILGRYLEREGGDPKWANLLDMVNGELRERLGGGDQLIGPSHFMKEDLDEKQVSRIWRYNVEPLIDDLFYGDRAAIAEFRWPSVIARFAEAAGTQPGETAP